ncbi:MAG: copper chaperone PCu(A)C [Actinobacteria bacterium]|nr:copper chaperone PCu(A)C [Actinomycetota bacterium]
MKRTFTVTAALALAAALAGCTSTVPTEQPTTTQATSTADAGSTATSEPGPADVAITDPWVKATDTEMTGAFGILENNTDSPIHVVAVTSSVTDRNELHEMVMQDGAMVMVEMEDGFTIEPGTEFVLEPGGNHLMLMDLPTPIEAGENVEMTLEFEDGSTFSWIAPARTFAGANEEYVEEGMEATPTP